MGLRLHPQCMGQTLWGEVYGALGCEGGGLGAAVHRYSRFTGCYSRRRRQSVLQGEDKNNSESVNSVQLLRIIAPSL